MQLQIPKTRRRLRLQAWRGLGLPLKTTHEASTLTIRYGTQPGLVCVFGLFQLATGSSSMMIHALFAWFRPRGGGYPPAGCWPSIIRGADSVASSRAEQSDELAPDRCIGYLIIISRDDQNTNMQEHECTLLHSSSTRTNSAARRYPAQQSRSFKR